MPSPQVNGISLIGESHKEVVRILKELPLCVYMACCRPAPVPQTDADVSQSDDLSTESLVKVWYTISGIENNWNMYFFRMEKTVYVTNKDIFVWGSRKYFLFNKLDQAFYDTEETIVEVL